MTFNSQHDILASIGTFTPTRFRWTDSLPLMVSLAQSDFLLHYLAFNCWFIVTSDCHCVVPKLINELRWPFRNPGKSSSRSWNQSRQLQCVSPFACDQHKSHLFLRFTKEPINPSTHGACFPNHFERPISCAVNAHHVPRRRGT